MKKFPDETKAVWQLGFPSRNPPELLVFCFSEVDVTLNKIMQRIESKPHFGENRLIPLVHCLIFCSMQLVKKACVANYRIAMLRYYAVIRRHRCLLFFTKPRRSVHICYQAFCVGVLLLQHRIENKSWHENCKRSKLQLLTHLCLFS